jgi:acetyl esterase/lipase
VRHTVCVGVAAAFLAAPQLALLAATVPSASLPSAIYTDPAHDAEYPATVSVLHIPIQGVTINGLAYIPSGAGPHPVLVICHGLPGNEKNLDLAQAVRRAGWVAVTFNYRGSWGSGGTFSFIGNLADAAAVLTYLRDAHNAAALRADPKRIAIAGHSMGGFVAAKTASQDSGLIGTVLISAWDPSRPTSHERLVAQMAGDMESLAGVTAESMAAEIDAHRKEMALGATAGGLKGKPLLVLTADDGLAQSSDALVQTIRAGGGPVSSAHVATDHSWSDRRIELEARVIGWLQSLR